MYNSSNTWLFDLQVDPTSIVFVCDGADALWPLPRSTLWLCWYSTEWLLFSLLCCCLFGVVLLTRRPINCCLCPLVFRLADCNYLLRAAGEQKKQLHSLNNVDVLLVICFDFLNFDTYPFVCFFSVARPTDMFLHFAIINCDEMSYLHSSSSFKVGSIFGCEHLFNGFWSNIFVFDGFCCSNLQWEVQKN